MELEYRLDQTTGLIFTRDEFFNEKVFKGTIEKWENMPIIPNPTDEVREKLYHIYSKPWHSLSPGDIIKSSVTDRDSAVVIECGDKLIVQLINRGNNMRNGGIEWEGPFVKLANVSGMDFSTHTTSFVDTIKPYQIAYNIAMSKIK